MESAKTRTAEHRHLHLLRLDLLAEVLGRAPDHQARDEDRQNGEHQHAVEAAPTPPKIDLAELMLIMRDHAAERREAVVHAVDGAA